MNRPMPRGAFRYRSSDSSRPSRFAGALPRIGRLVGGAAAAGNQQIWPLVAHVWPTCVRAANARLGAITASGAVLPRNVKQIGYRSNRKGQCRKCVTYGTIFGGCGEPSLGVLLRRVAHREQLLIASGKSLLEKRI